MTQAAVFLTSAQATRALTGVATEQDFSLAQAEKLIDHFAKCEKAREAREEACEKRKRARSATASKGKKSPRRRATRSTSPPEPQDEPGVPPEQASSSSVAMTPSDSQMESETLKFRFEQYEATAHLFEQQGATQLALMQERLKDLHTLLAADHAMMHSTSTDLDHYIADKDQAMVSHTSRNWRAQEEIAVAHQQKLDRLVNQLNGLKNLIAEVAGERELVQDLFLKLQEQGNQSDTVGQSVALAAVQTATPNPDCEPPGLLSQFLHTSKVIHNRMAQFSGYVRQWNQV